MNLVSENKILVIDDEEINLKIIQAMLIPMGYNIILYKSPLKALEDIKTINPDVILLDIMMPIINGFEFLKKVRKMEEVKNTPIVMVTALDDVESRVLSLELGADDFLLKPVDKTELRARVKSLIKVKNYYDHMKQYNKVLEEEVRKRTLQISDSFKKAVASNKELEETLYNTVLMLFDLISAFDSNLAGHCKRVAIYASMITDNLNIDNDLKQSIKIAALLHDVGLIGIPKEKINMIEEHINEDKELEEIYRKHPLVNLRSFEKSKKYKEMVEIIECHHENVDGSGFPKGMIKEEIPLGSKIIAIADYYDRLRYEYTKIKEQNILSEVEGKVGTWFDKNIFEIFKDAISKEDPFSGIVEIYLEDLKEGITIAEPIMSLDTGVVILSSEIILDEEKLKKIRSYSSKYKLKNPVKVYRFE